MCQISSETEGYVTNISCTSYMKKAKNNIPNFFSVTNVGWFQFRSMLNNASHNIEMYGKYMRWEGNKFFVDLFMD